VDHGNGVTHRHLIGRAFHRLNRGKPLPHRFRTLGLGVVLAGFSPDPGAAQCIRAKHVARAACPDQVVRGGVFLMAVNVADFNRAGSATQTAPSFARRRAPVRAIA